MENTMFRVMYLDKVQKEIKSLLPPLYPESIIEKMTDFMMGAIEDMIRDAEYLKEIQILVEKQITKHTQLLEILDGLWTVMQKFRKIAFQ